MKAILVSVDYADILAMTLPYNRHHFEDVMVVTSPTDEATMAVAEANDAQVFVTDAFYRDGAVFNKFRALELGLDAFGRQGWLCIMDADIVWPKEIPEYQYVIGCLYTPLRYMKHSVTTGVPPESDWAKYPLHRQQREWAGYTQIFNGLDSHLGQPPWHETDWVHAGGGDSFFQFKWPDNAKLRPPFEVLHLGESGINWCGRASELTDGSTPEDANRKVRQVREFIRSRTSGPNRFAGEKIVITNSDSP